MDHMRPRVQEQPEHHGKTPSLFKIQKLAGRGGGSHLQSQLFGRLRQENRLNLGGRDCSDRRLNHSTPAWVTERDSISKKERERKENKGTLHRMGVGKRLNRLDTEFSGVKYRVEVFHWLLDIRPM